jgi:FlgD Ig-like domain
MNTAKSLPTLVLILCLNLLQSVSAQFSFSLPTSATTSAGIYNRDGLLIRTLWGGKRLSAGTHTGYWDGTTDDGTVAPVTNYNIRVLSNNVNYTWEGVLGNTSASFTGTTIHKGYLRMYSMAFAGNTGYYSNYYNEGHSSQFKFSVSNPQSRTEIFSYGQSTMYVATDGTNVYWAGDDVLGGHNNWFVFGTKVSDDNETSFSAGQSYTVQYGRTYGSVIDLTHDQNANITGMAVQKNGNYLFVSRQNYNQVRVLNKTTGALVTTLTITSPQRLAVDASDNLWIVSGAGINKYTVNSNGTLGSTLAAITGVAQPWAIAVSPDNTTVTIADGARSQQVKGYSNSTGSLLWTYGQQAGYATSPVVSDDKFYFDDQRHNNDGSFLAYQPDGSFWVEDPGNYRAQHYTASRTFIDRIMYLPGFYGCSADPNNSARSFADFLEFSTNYSMTLAPNNGSWALTKNWGFNVTPDYTYMEGIKFVTTLSNGSTYAFLRHYDKYAVVELAATGIRYTGVETSNLANQLQKDGSILEWGGGPVGRPFGAGVHLLAGFDASNNPSWGTAFSDLATTEAMIASDPNASGSGNVVKTSSGLYVAFDAGLPPNSSSDYHLGGFKGSNWAWKTAKSTYTEYAGPFPYDGYYDIGNGVIYGGSVAAALDNSIVWGYHGEFWKGGECNFYNHVNDDGLFIGQFGTGSGTNAPPELAGNSTSLALVKDGNGNGYLYNNDESVHGGLHRWKITGLNTITEQVIPIDVSFVRTDEKPPLPGVDLMAGLPFNTFLPNASGWQNSDPNAYDGATLTWWYGKTNNFTYHKRESPDVYITFHQNAYLSRSVTRDLGNNISLLTWKLAGVINYNNSLPDGLGGVTFLEVVDNNDKVIARLNHEVIFGANNSRTTNMYGNYNLMHTDQSDAFSDILWKDQPVEISADYNGITFKYGNFAPITVPVLDPASDWMAPKKMRVYISGGGGYDRRIELISMRFINIPGVLPINLTDFNLTCQNGQVKLTWKTAQEMNSSYFNAERSADGINWTVIKRVAAAGNSTTETSYSVTDNNPGKFYRIAGYDADGKKTLSKTITANCGGSNAPQMGYIYNPIGQLVLRKLITNANNSVSELKQSGLKKGIYFIKYGDQNTEPQEIFIP